MLHALLAALQITWSGIGSPPGAHTVRPAIISRPPAGRAPNRPVQFQLLLDGTPAGADWSVDPNDALLFTDTDPSGYYGGTSQMYALPSGAYHGPVTIRASHGNGFATLPGYVYPSAAVSCYVSFENGLLFDDNGFAKPAAQPQSSDIFVTGPANGPRDQFRGCTGAFVDPFQVSYPVHVPYGGTVVRAGSGTFFGDLSVKNWRDDFTRLPAVHPGDAVLFKTRDGRVVKFLVYPFAGGSLSGAYLTGPPRGDFEDYVRYHRLKMQPRAIFGSHG